MDNSFWLKKYPFQHIIYIIFFKYLFFTSNIRIYLDHYMIDKFKLIIIDVKKIIYYYNYDVEYLNENKQIMKIIDFH